MERVKHTFATMIDTRPAPRKTIEQLVGEALEAWRVAMDQIPRDHPLWVKTGWNMESMVYLDRVTVDLMKSLEKHTAEAVKGMVKHPWNRK